MRHGHVNTKAVKQAFVYLPEQAHMCMVAKMQCTETLQNILLYAGFRVPCES